MILYINPNGLLRKQVSRVPVLLLLTAIVAILISPKETLSADVLDQIKPGEWYEIPNSHLETVKPSPLPKNNSGFAVIAAWSGGSYDTKRDRFLVWGGGHSDYSGNEIYAFDVATLKWLRLTEPSTDVGGDEGTGIYPDGTPRSRHTYDYIEYVPPVDGLCTFGGGAMYPTAKGTKRVHCFDFTANQWVEKASVLSTGGETMGALSGYDASTGKIWLQTAGNNAPLMEWTPTTNTWKKDLNYSKGFFPYTFTGAAGAGYFVGVGGGQTLVYDLQKTAPAMVNLTLKGDVAAQSPNSPGVAYDSKRNLYVSWSGGGSVYAFDVGTATWTKMPLDSSNTATPGKGTANGIFGRFQYIPSRDLFIGVTDATQNVFLFRMPNGYQSATPIRIPKKTGFLVPNPKFIAHQGSLLATENGPVRLFSMGKGVFSLLNGQRLRLENKIRPSLNPL